MGPEKLAALVNAIKFGSISRVAQEMGYTQSGISHMLKNLEMEVGFPLFIRTSTGIRPNNEAITLLPMIRELLRHNEHLEQTVAAMKGLEIGNIKVASFSSVAIHWLPSILCGFETQHPNIKIQIAEGGVDEVEKMMEDSQVDLAIYARSPAATFDWIPLKEDPLLAIMSPEHPAAGNTEFPIEKFLDDWFIAPSLGFDYDVHRILRQLPRFPKIKYSSRNDYAIIAMVSKGLGLSIVPRLILEGAENVVEALPLSPRFSRILGVGIPKLKNASPAAHAFIKFLRQNIS